MFYIYVIVTISGVTVLFNMYYAYRKKKLILTLWDENTKLNDQINYLETFTFFINTYWKVPRMMIVSMISHGMT